MEVQALDLGGEQETLGLPAEQEDSGMGRLAGVEQIKMCERLGSRGVFTERVLPLTSRDSEKGLHLGFGQIAERGIRAGGGVKGARAQVAGAFEVFDQAGVKRGVEVGDVGEATADKLRLRLANECGHSGVAGLIVGPLDENQAGFAFGGGTVEFEFSWGLGHTFRPTVFVAKQPDLNAAAIHFAQINFIGPAIRRGQILEQKDLKETAQERVALNKVLHRPPFDGQFFLHTAEKDEDFAHA